MLIGEQPVALCLRMIGYVAVGVVLAAHGL